MREHERNSVDLDRIVERQKTILGRVSRPVRPNEFRETTNERVSNPVPLHQFKASFLSGLRSNNNSDFRKNDPCEITFCPERKTRTISPRRRVFPTPVFVRPLDEIVFLSSGMKNERLIFVTHDGCRGGTISDVRSLFHRHFDPHEHPRPKASVLVIQIGDQWHRSRFMGDLQADKPELGRKRFVVHCRWHANLGFRLFGDVQRALIPLVNLGRTLHSEVVSAMANNGFPAAIRAPPRQHAAPAPTRRKAR